MKFLKGKNLWIIAAVAAIVILGGGYFVLSQSMSHKPPTTASTDQQINIPTIQPQDIGLSLSSITFGKFAGNGVEIKITKLSGIASIDYELDYISTGNIPRGAIGHVDVKPSQTVVTQDLPFGTCSDVCHFDTGISGIKITLKVTKTDGTSFQLTQPFNQ